MDEVASILSYITALSRSSSEWSALKDSILEVAKAAKTIYEVHEKTGAPKPPGLQPLLNSLLESLRQGDISEAARIVQDSSPLLRRASAAYLALYRLLILTVSIPSLAGVLIGVYLAFTVSSPVASLAALTVAGLLAASLIAPPRYASYPLLASSLILASIYAYSGEAPASILLYSVLLATTAILAGALRSGIGPGPVVARGI
ncbi:MAG: hypothetical protein F7C08_00235 [Desulfurococcales archaeon]|nr:hypothetical protein [Desulfurococcales archaeon]MCE4604956.1 hypothetical protein [Desulfurococcales archaeon]